MVPASERIPNRSGTGSTLIGSSPPAPATISWPRKASPPSSGDMALASWCMMSATEKIFMSNSTLTSAKPPGNWTQLNKQLAQAKTLLRRMSQTVEDIEDARTIERAKRANGNKPRIPWAQVKKELQLD